MSAPFDPQVFIYSELPAKLMPAAAALSEPLTLQLLVPGRADCRTHFELRNDSVAVHQGFAEKPDVTLSIQLPELEQLSRGGLDLDEALVLGRVQVFGDRQKAKALARPGALW